MRDTALPTDRHDEPTLYEIRIKGHLDDRWIEWFDGLSFTRDSDGTTILAGPVVDQAALHGVLRKVRNLFAAIQPIHPADVVASVSTTAWHIITPLKWVMCLLFLVGITGIYARQVKEAGWLGLAGFVLLIFTWWLQAAFVFAEAFVAPPLTSRAPAFVDALVGISYGHTGGIDLGVMPAFYAFMGITYMLGGLVFGIATFRARILPRWAAGLLAVTATLTPLASLLPHQQQRYAAVPMGIALACLGYTLFTERREPATSPVPGTASPQLHPAEVR